MDILLTGATGFIGSYLLPGLVHSHRLYAMTRQNLPPNRLGLNWIFGDLSIPGSITSLPSKIDAVVCLAQSRAYRQFPEQAQDIFEVNTRATLALLEYARRAGAHTFIFTSTANVYRQSGQRISENFPIEPLSFYARSKQMAEMLVEAYREYFDCTVLRLFTVYGPGQRNMLVPNIIEKIQKGEPLQVQGKHGFKISPIYISDVIQIFQKLLEREHAKPGFEIYNIGGDELLGIYQLGSLIGQALNSSPNFEFIPGIEPKGWMADIAKIRAALELGIFISMQDGLKTVIEQK